LGKKNIPEKLRIAELMVDLLRFGVRNSKWKPRAPFDYHFIWQHYSVQFRKQGNLGLNKFGFLPASHPEEETWSRMFAKEHLANELGGWVSVGTTARDLYTLCSGNKSLVNVSPHSLCFYCGGFGAFFVSVIAGVFSAMKKFFIF
jgi:hypothetical protein